MILYSKLYPHSSSVVLVSCEFVTCCLRFASVERRIKDVILTYLLSSDSAKETEKGEGDASNPPGSAEQHPQPLPSQIQDGADRVLSGRSIDR